MDREAIRASVCSIRVPELKLRISCMPCLLFLVTTFFSVVWKFMFLNKLGGRRIVCKSHCVGAEKAALRVQERQDMDRHLTHHWSGSNKPLLVMSVQLKCGNCLYPFNALVLSKTGWLNLLFLIVWLN